MISFKKKNRGLIFSYSPESNDGAWVVNRLRQEGRVRISNIFWFESGDLTSPRGLLETKMEYDPDGEEFRFLFAREKGQYYRISGRKLGIQNDVLIARDMISIERKTFVAERNINIFRRLSVLKDDDSPIIVGGEKDGAISSEVFTELLAKFPNSGEMDRYASARVEAVVGEVLMPMRSARELYEHYLDRRASSVRTDALKQDDLLQSEIDKYVYLRDLISKWLEDVDAHTEADWQKLIVKIILLLFPKYIAVLSSVRIADYYSVPGELKHREIDLCLVDAAGNLDVIEIKKPFDNGILGKTLYRDNHVPTRELTGCVIQTEKYLFHLSKWGVQGERKLTARYTHQLPRDLSIRITSPKAIIIMGRDPQARQRKERPADLTLDLEVIKRQYANVMDILTYDDLLRRLDRIISSLRKQII